MAHDTSRPYIRSVTPTANASGVSIASIVAVVFSERMDSTTLNSANIGIYKDPILLLENTTFSYNQGHNLLTITPSGNLDVNTRYSAVVSGTVQDYYGNAMGMDYWWNFWTGQPSGYIHTSGTIPQPSGYELEGYLEVLGTDPEEYTTNQSTSLTSSVLIYLNDEPAIGNRNYFGNASGINPAVFGEAFFETPSTSLMHYLEIDNQEVLGNPGVTHTAPTWTAAVSGTILRIDGVGWLNNNEYIVTLKEGFPGLTTHPLQAEYQFVFTTTYTPLYAGANILRLNIGPMLQMAMAYIPDDTLNRFIYEASISADRISPTTIDPNNVPWYVSEYVIYQSKLNSLYAAIMIFAGSGAGVRKTLADLTIEVDARGLMPALLPILEDYRKLRDYYMAMVRIGTDSGPEPVWVIPARNSERRPITDTSWRRLPFTDVRGREISSIAQLDQTPNWIYAKDLSRRHYITHTRYLKEGRYVTE